MSNRKQKANGKTFLLSLFAVLGVSIIAAYIATAPTLHQEDSQAAEASAITSRLGTIHVAGGAIDRRTQGDFLVYGAKDAYDLGFRTFEIFMDPRICRAQPNGAYQTKKYCNTQKDTEMKAASLLELAKDPDFNQVLHMNFRTFQITIDALNKNSANQIDIGGQALGTSYNNLKEITAAKLTSQYKEFYDFTKYLLETFNNSNKTFYLMAPSELDWHLVAWSGCRKDAYAGEDDACLNEEVHPTAVKNAIAYLNNIKKAIDDAKKDTQYVGVEIYQACELNMVRRRSMRGKDSALTAVIPKTNCDFVAYSAHEITRDVLGGISQKEVTDTIAYLESKIPDSEIFGKSNFFISELRLDVVNKMSQSQRDLMKTTLATLLESPVKSISIWQLYDACTTPGVAATCEGRGLILTGKKLNWPAEIVKATYTERALGNGRVLKSNFPKVIKKGESYAVTVTLQNTGLSKWTNESYFWSDTNVDDNNIWQRIWTKARVPFPHDIMPGDVVTLSYRIKAPTKAGVYNLEWQLLRRGIGFFGQKVTSQVTVTD